ncbi:ABC transporter substrate-binding protein [Herbaspirillum sp. YR522]|uniref:substrate-binding periplasmic protein n=1 Tax=Herbaspirillum sp. YR522 TaxID=1144342 RepID=UPI00026F5306|nr:ABC transporter substrate-binding protein [Herbaspirillum sp. YR522]EJN10316.1 periplasmic component of amino acid ABC-type transporter/signal transduction system [Herbaspirillum sp. YR522]
MFKKFASLVLAVAVLGSTLCAPAHAAGELDAITKRGELRIGYIPSPPGTNKDPATGELTGFYVEIAKSLAAQMNVKPVFVETTWANFVAGLQAKQFDMSIGATFATVKRAMAVDFSTPLFYLGSVAVVKANDNRFKTPADMNKPEIKIAVVQGTAAEDWVRQTMPNAKVTSLAGGNLTAGFMEVAAGRVDASFEDSFTAGRFVEQQPSTKVIFGDKPVFFLPIAWTVKKGNTELQEVISISIRNLILSNQMNTLVGKYLKGGRYLDTPNLTEFPK